MKASSLKTPSLATVYLDNEAIGLMGDPKPRVSKIIVAGGKKPEAVQVLRGQSASDTHGKALRPDETIDRTENPTAPIYLTSALRTPGTSRPLTEGESPPGGSSKSPAQWRNWPSGDEPEPRPREPFPPQSGG